jgi:hypothetical protein
LFATLKGLRGFVVDERRRNPDKSGLRLRENVMPFPKVAKAQPWAGISERFQRYSFSDESSQKWVAL